MIDQSYVQCSFCGEALVSFEIVSGEEFFCCTRHRDLWQEQVEQRRGLAELHTQVTNILVIGFGRKHFGDTHYG